MRDAWQMWRGNQGFSNELVDAVVNAGIKNKPNKATTFNQQESVRSSRVSWINNETWVRDTLYEYIKLANRNAFNVRVENFADLQYTEYHASEEGHYGWHTDVSWIEKKPFDRKLSITVQLSNASDYEGGDFEFDEVETPDNSKEKGTVLIFPSYLSHRVLPITSGVRRSLVAWFEGPRWN